MSAAELLTGLVTQAGVTVVAETNVTPAIVLYDARDTSPSLLDLLGIKVYARVVTSDGRAIASYGEPVAFDPVVATVAAAALLSLSLLVSSILLRIIRK